VAGPVRSTITVASRDAINAKELRRAVDRREAEGMRGQSLTITTGFFDKGCAAPGSEFA
jgi:hypothetical protein